MHVASNAELHNGKCIFHKTKISSETLLIVWRGIIKQNTIVLLSFRKNNSFRLYYKWYESKTTSLQHEQFQNVFLLVDGFRMMKTNLWLFNLHVCIRIGEMHFLFVCILGHHMIRSNEAILQRATFLHYCFIANHAILNDTPENEKENFFRLKFLAKLCAIWNEIGRENLKCFFQFFFSLCKNQN